MNRYRLIIVSLPDGRHEDVLFLEAEYDEGEPATDYCERGQTIDHDLIIEAELPDGFPIGQSLRRTTS